MKLRHHIYNAIRHGQWSWGWGQVDGKMRLGVFYDYYDGNHLTAHIGWLWLGVYY